MDMFIHMGIFESRQITLFPCFTFISNTRVSFDCVGRGRRLQVRNPTLVTVCVMS